MIENEKFKYITYHTTTKTYYSDIKLENFNNSKILLNMSGHLNPIIVDNCNITESKFYIELQKEDDKKLINIFKNNNIKKYLELCKYSGFNSRIVLENITYNLDDLEDILEDYIEEKPVLQTNDKNKKYTVPELRNLLKEKGMKGYSKLKKQELIELLGK